MKKLLLAIAAVLLIALPASAKDIKTTTIKLPTLQCGTCKRTIESKLSGLRGLDSITVDVEQKVATVVYDADVTTLKSIEKAISKAGYDANDTKADARAQKKLSPCCQPGGEEE
jgi:copper chaperone CopZ